MTRVQYKISGILPAPWEDFRPVDESLGLPCFTIEGDAGFLSTQTESPDGWFDIAVAGPLTVELASKAILNHLQSKFPDITEVEILEQGVCQAV